MLPGERIWVGGGGGAVSCLRVGLHGRLLFDWTAYLHGESWTGARHNPHSLRVWICPSLQGILGREGPGLRKPILAHRPYSPDTVCWATAQFPQESDKDTLLCLSQLCTIFNPELQTSGVHIALFCQSGKWGQVFPSPQLKGEPHRTHTQSSAIMWIMSFSLLGGKVISTILRIKRHSCYQINYLTPHWTVTKRTRRRMTFIYAPSYPSPPNNHIFLRPSKKQPLKKPSSYVWWGNTILLSLKLLCAPPILFQCQNKRQRNPYIDKNKQGLIFFSH